VVVLPNIVEIHTACEALPLFPLPGSVFLPNTMLPLHVFETRYQALIADVMQSHRILAVPRLRPGWESNYEGTPAIFPVCGLGKIVHHEPLGDGRSNIAIVGLCRVRVRGEARIDCVESLLAGTLTQGMARA
jgi:Lon protease-like protein